MYRAHAQIYGFRTPVLSSDIEIFPRSSVKQGSSMILSAVWDTGATRAFICDLPYSVNILIGMDIIQLGDFHISNAGGKTLFSFVIPSLPTPFSLAEEADKLNSQKS